MTPYELNQMCSGIEVGDTVKIVREAEDEERGWGNVWCSAMSLKVGQNFVVAYIREHAGISDGIYAYPYFALEIVKKADK